MRLTRLALPHLRASGRGRVVNITSWSVREPIPNLMLSNAIRPGVIGWAKTLAHELGPDGITVNTIAPGKIDTDRVRELWGHYPDPAAAEQADIQAVPARPARHAGRDRRPRSRSCARRRAAYISGAVLPVDGGAAARRLVAARRGRSYVPFDRRLQFPAWTRATAIPTVRPACTARTAAGRSAPSA